jgi:phosphoenolpyruvate carboxylase
MIACASNISPSNCLGVVRAFTQTLNLVNAAEVHHRMRVLRQYDKQSSRVSPLPLIEDSVAGTFARLLAEGEAAEGGRGAEVRKQELYRRLLRQKVEIVLTAHPTEVNRKTLLLKYRSISELLAVLDGADMTPFERQQTTQQLQRQVASIWGSDEIRRQKPSPQQESRGGLAIVESVLWDALPSYLRKLSLQCEQSLGGRALPLTHVPIKFSSWMGGDRDGNPNVTPEVTLEIALTQVGV